MFVGDAFNSLGDFISQLDISLTREAGANSPMLGDIEQNALVIEGVDELGPATVVDFTDGGV